MRLIVILLLAISTPMVYASDCEEALESVYQKVSELRAEYYALAEGSPARLQLGIEINKKINQLSKDLNVTVEQIHSKITDFEVVSKSLQNKEAKSNARKSEEKIVATDPLLKLLASISIDDSAARTHFSHDNQSVLIKLGQFSRGFPRKLNIKTQNISFSRGKNEFPLDLLSESGRYGVESARGSFLVVEYIKGTRSIIKKINANSVKDTFEFNGKFYEKEGYLAYMSSDWKTLNLLNLKTGKIEIREKTKSVSITDFFIFNNQLIFREYYSKSFKSISLKSKSRKEYLVFNESDVSSTEFEIGTRYLVNASGIGSKTHREALGDTTFVYDFKTSKKTNIDFEYFKSKVNINIGPADEVVPGVSKSPDGKYLLEAVQNLSREYSYFIVRDNKTKKVLSEFKIDNKKYGITTGYFNKAIWSTKKNSIFIVTNTFETNNLEFEDGLHDVFHVNFEDGNIIEHFIDIIDISISKDEKLVSMVDLVDDTNIEIKVNVYEIKN